MIDDRLLQAFGTFGAPAEPDAAFADRLFEELATELGLRRAARPEGSIGARILRVFGVERLPVGRHALRLAYLMAILGLLVGLLVAAALIASQLDSRPSPLDLVQLSQNAYDHAPALRFTIHTPDLDAVVMSDGRGVWRSEVSGTWGEAAGSYSLYDGERVGWYDSTVRTWKVVPLEDGGPPYPFNNEFTWTKVDYPGERASLSTVPCDGPTDLGQDLIAGRTTDHVGCPAIAMEYWLDRETHLVLRTLAREGSPYWMGPVNHDTVTEVATFEALAAVTPSAFAWSGPPGAFDPDAPLASTVLAVGERPPAWQGRTTAGTVVKSGELPTPAAVLFFALAGCDCDEAFDDFAAVAPAIDGLTSVIVAYDDSGGGNELMAGYVMQHPTAIPVVTDPGAIAQVWGINPRPSLVLLASDGTVAGMHGGPVTRDDLERILAAVAGGTPIPSVAPAPSPTPTPGDPSLDPSVVCSEDLVTCLPVGSQMPQWSYELMQGESIGTAELAGKPAVLLFGNARCDGPCPEWFLDELANLGRLADAYRDRATVVMISDGENQAGETQAAFEAAGVDIPVVFDLDGSLADRFALIVFPNALVFDADGRYVDHVAFPGISSAGPILDDLLAGAEPSGTS